MKKTLRALAAAVVLALMFPLLPTSPAAANSTSSIGTTFAEAVGSVLARSQPRLGQHGSHRS